MKYVPVIAPDGEQLMPTIPPVARHLIKKGDATPFWNNGIWCIRLNREPSARYKQEIAVGLDPGSKKEGFSVKSEKHTYLNVQADAHTSTKKKIEKRANSRRSRRNRKCRSRKWRGNRNVNKKSIPPSTMSRWSWKVRIVDFLLGLFPITACVVEDIYARKKKGNKQWNENFAPLEIGKQWFYKQMEQRFEFFDTLKGFETKELRNRYSLEKLEDKLSSDFHAHCVDAWVLATHAVGGAVPYNKKVLCIKPPSIQRRCLHREKPKKGGIRTRYGGTRCLGYTKGTLIKTAKYGLAIISGYTQRGYLRLTNKFTNKTLTWSYNPIQQNKIKKRLNFLVS